MTQRLPAGKYYIGDPCYVFNDKTWDHLNEVHWDSMSTGEIFEHGGGQVWMHTTKFGDGVYDDQNGTEYGVDSGLIGIVPIALIEDPAGEENGTILEFARGVTVSYDNGTFYIGNITIKTNSDIDLDFDEDEVDGGYGDADNDRFI
jgi:hypothetical protein